MGLVSTGLGVPLGTSLTFLLTPVLPCPILGLVALCTAGNFYSTSFGLGSILHKKFVFYTVIIILF